MDQEQQDYADPGGRNHLPTPAALVGLVPVVLVSALIVTGFIAAVVLLDRRPLPP